METTAVIKQLCDKSRVILTGPDIRYREEDFIYPKNGRGPWKRATDFAERFAERVIDKR